MDVLASAVYAIAEERASHAAQQISVNYHYLLFSLATSSSAWQAKQATISSISLSIQLCTFLCH